MSRPRPVLAGAGRGRHGRRQRGIWFGRARGRVWREPLGWPAAAPLPRSHPPPPAPGPPPRRGHGRGSMICLFFFNSFFLCGVVPIANGAGPLVGGGYVKKTAGSTDLANTTKSDSFIPLSKTHPKGRLRHRRSHSADHPDGVRRLHHVCGRSPPRHGALAVLELPTVVCTGGGPSCEVTEGREPPQERSVPACAMPPFFFPDSAALAGGAGGRR